MGLAIKYNKEEFVKRATNIHNNKYDYSKSDYKNSRDKIEILCPVHGSFYQMPYNHLQGKGCLHCSHNQKFTIENFIKLFHRSLDGFVIAQSRDKLKGEYCLKNNIELFIIRYDEDIKSRMLDILSKIKQ